MNDELVERVSYRLARTNWLLTSDEQWNERQHWKVSRMVYDAMARDVIDLLKEENVTK